jgi:glutamyl-tRNA reductase
VQLKRGDGAERHMRPRHIVFANGVSTAAFRRLRQRVGLAGQARALVLGTGTPRHDLAQDLCVSGAAEVTVIQRSPPLVVGLKEP